LFILLIAFTLVAGEFCSLPIYAKKKSNSKRKSCSIDSSVTVIDPDEKTLEGWLDVCETMGINLNKKKFRYSYSGPYKSYQSALAGKRRTNCAQFVSWCLQEYDILNKGETYYVMGSSIHKNFKKWDKSKVSIIEKFEDCGDAGLKAGDVVCWAGKAHTCIYAGRDKKGRRTWIDAGRQSTYGKCSGSRFKKVKANPNKYLDRREVAYIIRIKGLK
jgi:hypothetical protein